MKQLEVSTSSSLAKWGDYPVHDSLYVNIGMAEETKKTMKSAFNEILGGNIKVY